MGRGARRGIQNNIGHLLVFYALTQGSFVPRMDQAWSHNHAIGKIKGVLHILQQMRRQQQHYVFQQVPLAQGCMDIASFYAGSQRSPS